MSTFDLDLTRSYMLSLVTDGSGDMRVVRVVRFGGPEVLVPGEAPDPVAGPGQVVVEVVVAGMTFVETQIRRGTDRWHERPSLPYVPGVWWPGG